MHDNDLIEKISRLNFEDFLWIIFAILSIINIYGNFNAKKYLETNNNYYNKESNKIFEITLTIAFFIYLYFFIRNYNAYKNANNNEKDLYLVKLLGSSLFIAAVICLLYFQEKQNTFIGSPSI